ncbi:hypothetical protein V3W47_15395 [Deinococcus sp. YIM 134068]
MPSPDRTRVRPPAPSDDATSARTMGLAAVLIALWAVVVARVRRRDERRR